MIGIGVGVQVYHMWSENSHFEYIYDTFLLTCAVEQEGLACLSFWPTAIDMVS